VTIAEIIAFATAGGREPADIQVRIHVGDDYYNSDRPSVGWTFYPGSGDTEPWLTLEGHR
jgi:hypothetical protein